MVLQRWLSVLCYDHAVASPKPLGFEQNCSGWGHPGAPNRSRPMELIYVCEGTQGHPASDRVTGTRHRASLLSTFIFSPTDQSENI